MTENKRLYDFDEGQRPQACVNLIVDESGSMNRRWDETIAAINEYLESLREATRGKDEEVRVTLTLFNGNARVVYANVPLELAEGLSRETYRPGGSTALFDALGQTIEAVDADPSNANARKLYLILTDGQENCSRQFQREALFRMVAERQGEGKDSTFVFLGADIDAWGAAQQLGLDQGNTLSFAAVDTQRVMRSAARASVSYLADRSGSIDNYVQLMNQPDDPEPNEAPEAPSWSQVRAASDT